MPVAAAADQMPAALERGARVEAELDVVPAPARRRRALPGSAVEVEVQKGR